MLERMADRLVSEFLNEKMIKKEQKEEYLYVIICLMESSITIGSILLISLFFQKLVPTVCFLLSFLFLRKKTGGYHLNSFMSCYVGTISLSCVVVQLSDLLFERYIFVGGVIASMCIAVIGTVNHPNMKMTSNEMQVARKGARITLLVEDAFVVILKWMNADSMVVKCFFMGIIVCAVLLLIAKIVGQEVKN